MTNPMSFLIINLKEKLWFKPLLFCIFSIAVAFLAHIVDDTGVSEWVPDIDKDFIADLLKTLSSIMLVISTFAVASMLTAFASATGATSARSFSILVKDDVSQLALSVFIGAFIFSIVSSIALATGYYATAGKFALFVITILFFAAVIIVLLRWVDRISKLGRIGHTITLVEKAAAIAVSNYLKHPYLNGKPRSFNNDGEAIKAHSTGYLRQMDMSRLQKIATDYNTVIKLNCRPGKYVHENYTVAIVNLVDTAKLAELSKKINDAIVIGQDRFFENDPRFGIMTLSEIGSKALSPAINDPGTAIQILHAYVRIFFQWNKALPTSEVKYQQVEVPALVVKDFFEAAFRPIARDGAANIEVMIRLQKSLGYLTSLPQQELVDNALLQSKEAYQRAATALTYEADLQELKEAAICFNSKQ